VSTLNDEHGKPSSSRAAGLLLVALLVAVIVSHVWLGFVVEKVVYETLEVLILALVAGIAVRGATKTVAAARNVNRVVQETVYEEDGER
jgi:hypothetical protein